MGISLTVSCSLAIFTQDRISSFSTIFTFHTGMIRVNHRMIPHPHIFDITSNLYHDTRILMAECHRCGLVRPQPHPLLIIRGANVTGPIFDEDFGGANRWDVVLMNFRDSIRDNYTESRYFCHKTSRYPNPDKPELTIENWIFVEDALTA
jgi:hypothetical protein